MIKVTVKFQLEMRNWKRGIGNEKLEMRKTSDV